MHWTHVTQTEQTPIKCLDKQFFVLLFTHMPCISEQGLARLLCSRVTGVKTFCRRDCIRWGKGCIHILYEIDRIHLYTSPVNLKHRAWRPRKYMMFTRDACIRVALFPGSLYNKEKMELGTFYNVLDVKDRHSLHVSMHESASTKFGAHNFCKYIWHKNSLLWQS